MIPTPYLGQLSLGIALVLAIFLSGRREKHNGQQSLLSLGVFSFTLSALWILIYAHMTDDFRLLNVVMNSHTAKPMIYKITGVWGNHEGSMLLWTLFLSGYAALSGWHLHQLDSPLKGPAQNFMGLMLVGFLSFMLISCDPFTVLAFPAREGRDLNPLLQDPGLAIHPPALYMGYVGFVVPFVFSVAALLQKKLDTTWATATRKWALVAWSFQTLGLGLGSLWAYYELGWGGWWFWDPVENAALLPWLSGTALIHSLRVSQKTGGLKRWSVFLAIITFGLCLFGTFFVRSGFLTSVHTFAVDPERGIFLLTLGTLIIGPALLLFLRRFTEVESRSITSPLSRTGMLLLNNLFLTSATLTILLGTIYPLIMEAFDYQVTVGPPFYNISVVPLVVPFMVLMGVGPWCTWGRQETKQVLSLFSPWMAAAILVVGLSFTTNQLLELIVGVFALALLFETIRYLYNKRNEPKKSLSFYGMIAAHAGFAVAVLGMTLSLGQGQEKVEALAVGESLVIDDHSIHLKDVYETRGPNYAAQQARVIVKDEWFREKVIYPEKRAYWTQKVLHNETALAIYPLSQVYVSLGDQYKNGKWSLRVYSKPYINLIWIGAFLIAFGGLLSVLSRTRRRIAKSSAMVVVLMLLVPQCFAMNAHEVMSSPALETKARTIGEQLYCPVCSGQSISDSNAEMARLMRREVRALLKSGHSEEAIFKIMEEKYGETVLAKPTVSPHTYALWYLPWGLFLLLGVGVYIRWRRKSQKNPV